jgi:phospholipid/cholesterol/gamma-HCH transport system permease protein
MDSLISIAKLRSDGPRNGLLKLAIDGRLDADSTGRVWRESAGIVGGAGGDGGSRRFSDDYCDGSGIALLIQLRRLQQKAAASWRSTACGGSSKSCSTTGRRAAATLPEQANVRVHLVEEVGQSAVQLWDDPRVISFVGQRLCHGQVSVSSSTVRWRDTLLVAEEVGVNALPIVALLSFLVGVIMAFQAAVALRQFGAEIFVANMIGLSVLREMGPLMTAIILAGRSGSAFAAEIGTMKVREEIDALRTMGLEPVRFLVVPRVLAGVVMTPVLTVFADLLGVMGGSVVMMSLGFPLITFFNQLQTAVSYGSLVGGLVKAFAFGILIAAIGCLRGLQTQTGASAVGLSTTHAVVSGIILIVITDGIFSVIYYYLWV